MMDADELKQRAAAVAWWHGGMDLGHGVITHGGTNPESALLPRVQLPERLDGLSVLDVGTWDGYMAFVCERRGASRVVATDSFVWDNGQPNGGTGRNGFDLAREVYGSRVEGVHCEVLDLSPAILGTFDLVLFLGVLYHMRHPLLALERVAAMVKRGGTLIVETHTIPDSGNVMRFYPGSEWRDDPTNWWGPSVDCVMSMLRDVGFSDVAHVSQSNDRAMFHARW